MKVTLKMNSHEAEALYHLIATSNEWYEMNGKRTDLEPEEDKLKRAVDEWREMRTMFGHKDPEASG